MIVNQPVAARSARNFRPGALALPVAALPLVLAWNTDGYGIPKSGVSAPVIGAHRIVDWVVPACVAAVLTYGTARTGPDPRIAAGGRHDPRTAWWWRQSLFVGAMALVMAVSAVSLAHSAGERPVALVVPALAGTMVAACAANVVVTRWGAAPGTALACSLAVVGAVTVLPYWFAGASRLSIDPTLYGWAWGGTGRSAPLSTGALLWCLTGVAAVVAARLFPRDVAVLSWPTKDVTDDD